MGPMYVRVNKGEWMNGEVRDRFNSTNGNSCVKQEITRVQKFIQSEDESYRKGSFRKT